MEKYVFCQIFTRILKEITNEELKIKDYELLEDALRQYIITVLGFKMDYIDCMKEVEIAFENLINNSYKYKLDLITYINTYRENYINLMETHPYVDLFIKTVNNLYSKTFNIKKIDNEIKSKEISIAVKQFDKKLEIIRTHRIDEDYMPSIIINNVDEFEEILNTYINTIKYSDTFYNIFNNPQFSDKSEEEKIFMILESTMLNVSNFDVLNISEFFKKYIDYVNNVGLDSIDGLQYIGELFNDELYVKVKRAELLYETPYYLSFMLRNKRIELPNIRLGIFEENNKYIANILAVQDSRMKMDEENLEEVKKHIKTNMTPDNHFRFYNPNHAVSLILTFGLLKGMGIDNVSVKDYMPFRYKKVILDKQLSEEEGYKYQTRLTNKNIETIMRIITGFNGIEIENYPSIESEIYLKLGEDIKGKNEFVDNLFNLGYDLGCNFKRKTY